jgi:DNA-binding Lrp family transcriptional regulator
VQAGRGGWLVATGPANLFVAVWLRDLDHLYEFVTRDLGDLGVASADTLLVGETVKRPPGW